MGYVEASKTVQAPVEDVWNLLNDIDRTPEWVTGLERAEINTASPFGEGTIYTDYNRLGPIIQVTPWHITLFQPMSCQVHVSDSAALPSKMTLIVNPTENGTHVGMIVEYHFLPQLRGAGLILEELVMNRLLKGVLEQNLNSMNDYLQQHMN